MSTSLLEFEVVYPSREEAERVRAAAQDQGASANITAEPGLLPLAVLLVIAIPPGAALLIQVIDRVIHGWRDHGIIVDARGTGAPRILAEKDLPAGTVVTLTRDGEEAKRTDLPEQKVSDYVSAALTAIAGGASAADAASQASSKAGAGAAAG
ncbi:MAG: hypothetical protein M3077_05010 [Candidatus Dormibacteraeota bacterium]|nr:hypothetical protein [Candidatus Dormibacteraeota bacterium]